MTTITITEAAFWRKTSMGILSLLQNKRLRCITQFFHGLWYQYSTSPLLPYWYYNSRSQPIFLSNRFWSTYFTHMFLITITCRYTSMLSLSSSLILVHLIFMGSISIESLLLIFEKTKCKQSWHRVFYFWNVENFVGFFFL